MPCSMNMNPLMSLMLGEDEEELLRRRRRRMAPSMDVNFLRRITGVADPNPWYTPRPAYENNQLTSDLGINRYVDGSIQGANSLPYDVFDGLMAQKRADGIGPVGRIMNAFGIPGYGFSPRIFENEKAMDDMMSAFSTKGSPIYGDVDAARAQFDAMQVKRADKGREPITRVRNKGYNPGETPPAQKTFGGPAPGQKMAPKAVSYMK